jgi:RNA polymerase-binding transcription factor DksA
MDLQAEYLPIRAKLEHRLVELRGQVAQLEHHLRRVDGPHSADFEEQATDQEGDEVMQALDDSGRRELQDIESALARMDAGMYGICERTGRRIPLKRLQLVPTARETVPGKGDDD